MCSFLLSENMIWIYSILLCDAILLVQSQQISIDVNISQVFIQRISPDMLSWNDTGKTCLLILLLEAKTNNTMFAALISHCLQNEEMIFTM